MKTKVVVGALVIALIGVSSAFYLYRKPAEHVVTANSVYTLSADQLFKEFQLSEATANQKYLNQVITVKGRIADLSAVDSLGINIVLATDNPLFGVNCQVPGGDESGTLKPGDKVSIKGLCTGILMDVVLIKCRIEYSK